MLFGLGLGAKIFACNFLIEWLFIFWFLNLIQLPCGFVRCHNQLIILISLTWHLHSTYHTAVSLPTWGPQSQVGWLSSTCYIGLRSRSLSQPRGTVMYYSSEPICSHAEVLPLEPDQMGLSRTFKCAVQDTCTCYTYVKLFCCYKRRRVPHTNTLVCCSSFRGGGGIQYHKYSSSNKSCLR